MHDLICEVKRLDQLCSDVNALLTIVAFATEQFLAERPLLGECVPCIPRSIADGLASLCEVLKQVLIEDLIVSILQLLHLCLVSVVTREHRSQNCLSLEERLDLVLEHLLGDIFFHLLISEEKLSDFELMLSCEALTQFCVTFKHVCIEEHFHRVTDLVRVFDTVLVFDLHVHGAWNVLW